MRLARGRRARHRPHPRGPPRLRQDDRAREPAHSDAREVTRTLQSVFEAFPRLGERQAQRPGSLSSGERACAARVPRRGLKITSQRGEYSGCRLNPDS